MRAPASPKVVAATPKVGAPAVTKGATYWYVEGCPLAEQCSKASWAKCHNCTSWESEDHCRNLVFDHLRRSSLHYHDPIEEHREIAAQVQVLEALWEYEEDTEEHGDKRKPVGEASMPPPKQRRQREGDSGARGSGSSHLAVMRRNPTTTTPSQGPVVVVSPQVSKDDDMVLISRTNLKRMAESVERAAAAAAHAVKISTQAFRCRNSRV